MRKAPDSNLLIALVAGAFFMENLDGTVIATALPQMARSFHIGVVRMNIGMTAYLLTLAIFIPVSGWIADRLGARTVFATAVSIFTLASVLCGLAHSLPQFTCMRVLQGMGGALMVPVGRLVVLRSVPKHRLTQAIMYLSWPGLTALVLGPPVGGFIVTYATWRWIFFLNLPLGVLAMVLALRWIPEEPTHAVTPRYRFDWLTFLLAGTASAGIVTAMEQVGGAGATWQQPAALFTGSIACAVLAVLSARRNPETSLIDLVSLRQRSFAQGIYGATAFRIAVSVLPFLLPLMFQLGFGLSAFRSGLYLLALFAGDLSMKAIVVPTLRRWGFKRIIFWNGFITLGSMLLCATLSPATPVPLLLTVLFVHGAVRSLEFTAIGTLAYAEIPPQRMSRANGFYSTVVQLGLGLGIPIGAISLRLLAHLHRDPLANPALRDFHWAIVVASFFAIGPILNALLLPDNAGAESSGHLPAAAAIPEPVVN